MDRPGKTILTSTAAVLLIAGLLVLLVASPLLLLLGGWGGSDGGSILQGIASVLGLPWLIYIVFGALAILLLRAGRIRLAVAPALVPVAIEAWLLVAWLVRNA